MTSTVTQATKTFILSHTYLTVSTTVGVIAILLLMVLLVEKELLRAHNGPRARVGVGALNSTIAPLLFTFVVVISVRFVGILGPTQGTSRVAHVPAPKALKGSTPAPKAPKSPLPPPTLPLQSFAVLLNPGALRFTVHKAAASATATVRVVNIETMALPISVHLTGPDSRDFVLRDNCAGVRIKSYDKCTVTVAFTPHGASRDIRRAALVIADGLTPQVVPLSGRIAPVAHARRAQAAAHASQATSHRGSARPQQLRHPSFSTATGPSVAGISNILLLNPNAVDFGTHEVRTPSATRTIHVVNISAAPVRVTRLALVGSGKSAFTLRDTCHGSAVDVGGGCVITLRFTATKRGPYRAQVTMTLSSNRTAKVITVSGDGRAAEVRHTWAVKR